MPDFEVGGPTLKPTCPFCQLANERKIVLENDEAFVIEDGFAVSLGHMLVIPKRHSEHYFKLLPSEKAAVWNLVDDAVALARERYQPDGFNVGFNVMAAGGQTVFHTHVHIIPRYHGDVDLPAGGIRHVIPGKGSY
ncbi:HIT family protein [Flaviaesturariibacter amylovorans]